MKTNYSKNFNPNNYSFTAGELNNKKVIWISFPYDKNLISELRNAVKAYWNPAYKKWYVTDNKHYRNLFNIEVDYIGNSAQEITPINLEELNRFINELKLKAYSPNTIKTYSSEFIQLLKIIKNYPVKDLTPEKIKAYLLYCIQTLKLSENAIHSRMNAVKFYFEKVLHQEKMFLNIPRPKKPSTLPKAISTKDIKKMLEQIENLKHQLLLKICYGMGLRVSELVNLKITDIDSNRMQVHIRAGKGKVDRYAILPDSILEDLRKYYRIYKPKDYLFEGQHGGQYSVRSVQQVFKNAMNKAKINKKVGIHSLRHSYATHLIEQGTDIRFVQELLGHKNIKTTMIYTGLTDATKRKIKSPLDNL